MYCVIQMHIFRVPISCYFPLHHVFFGMALEPVICSGFTPDANVFLMDNICISLIFPSQWNQSILNPIMAEVILLCPNEYYLSLLPRKGNMAWLVWVTHPNSSSEKKNPFLPTRNSMTKSYKSSFEIHFEMKEVWTYLLWLYMKRLGRELYEVR